MDDLEFRRAVERGDVQTVRRELQAWRDVNQRFKWIRPWADRTALHVASWNGQTGVVELLIQHGTDVGARDKNVSEERARYVSESEAMRGHRGIGFVKELLLDITSGRRGTGFSLDDWTALHWASLSGQTGVVELLTQHGADVAARNK
ncbi:hypothetical protein Bbelb_099490 [Branchiostoma belcheri]|nr:hypothetical protein Bbelb_099490 [Branchiostoma belcheri]